jgi:ABC-type multidrug transport system fused ATPase/permease subunit
MNLNVFKLPDQYLIRHCFSVFSISDRKRLLLVILANIFLGLLDLIGVIAIGLVGSLAVFGISAGKANQNIENIFASVGLIGLSFQAQAAILTAVACSLFIIRTVLSMLLSRRILHFLSRKAAIISSELLANLLRLPIYKLQKKSTNDLIFILDNGMSAIALGVVGSSIILVSDAVLLLVMFLGLLLVNPSIAITTFVSFSLVGIVLFLNTHKRARRIGVENAKHSLMSNKLVFELFDNYRELFVKNKLQAYEEKIFKSRKSVASSIAEQQFLPTIGKYVIESSVILLGLFVSAFQFIVYDALTAISSLAIFLAAGSRLAPLVMRMQQYAIQIKTSSGLASPALEMIAELEIEGSLSNSGSRADVEQERNPALTFEDFVPTVSINHVQFSYSIASDWTLEVASLQIPEGSQVAIVGPSGGGKSTLVDVILGITEPDTGEVLISGLKPRDAIRKWPGAIGYVPQKITAIRGTLLENIALGNNFALVDQVRINEILELSQLAEGIGNSEKFEDQITDGGKNLSGGQLQRLGIARALYSAPKLIVFDEATSSLDGQTEEAISNAINSLKGKTTVFLIAHRLSSVRKADTIVYVDNGKILASGTIEEVKRLVPNFEIQAKLMGL